MLMDELHRDRALAHRAGDPLDRAGPHIAHNKDARHAALQHKRVTINVPAFGALATLKQLVTG